MPFRELLGQPRALELLRRFAANGRAPATIVFTGPEGSGRLLAARLFAEALICARAREPQGGGLFGGAPEPVADGGCGECAECRQVRAGTHPDYRVVRPPIEWDPPLWPIPKGREESRQILVEQTRELAREAELTPFSAPCKVFVIAPADRGVLNESAANALLKLLEEPSPNTYFFLIARSKRSLLPTLASRSVAVALAPLPERDADAILARLAPELSPAERSARLRLVEGRPGAAAELDIEKQRALLAEPLALLGAQGGERQARLRAIPGARDKVDEFASGLALALRDLCSLKAGRPARVRFPDGDRELRAALAATPEPEALLAWLTAWQAARSLNLGLRLQLEGRLDSPDLLEEPWLEAE